MASDSHTFALLLVDWNGVGWDKVGSQTAGRGGSGPEGEFAWSEYRLNDGTKLKWYMSTPDGKTGSVIINDRHYDLAAGPLVLLTKRGNGVEVEQVHVDLFNIKPDPAALTAAVRANGRARTFLAKAIKNNPLPPLAAR
ncbi:MAG TPA: hypothetical protein VFA18_23265 [Gemmataceae bacterium]|nr:hypothetical protein [Gemmataceae bacterium]